MYFNQNLQATQVYVSLHEPPSIYVMGPTIHMRKELRI